MIENIHPSAFLRPKDTFRESKDSSIVKTLDFYDCDG